MIVLFKNKTAVVKLVYFLAQAPLGSLVTEKQLELGAEYALCDRFGLFWG